MKETFIWLMEGLPTEGVRVLRVWVLLSMSHAEVHVRFLLDASVETSGAAGAVPLAPATGPPFRPQPMD